MAAFTLSTFDGDFRAYKAQIAAQYNGIKLTPNVIKLGTDNVTAAYLAKSPAGRVPLLETPDGAIFESNAIARYIAKIRRDTELTGRTFFETAQVDAWMDFCSHEVELPVSVWINQVIGYSEKDSTSKTKAAEDLNKALAVLERHLLLRTYLVGESITLADICLAAVLYYPFKLVLDDAARKPFPSVTRWYVTCANQREFKAILGECVLADAVATTAEPTKAGGAAKAGKAKEEKAAAPKADAAGAAVGAGAGAAPKAKEEKPKKKKDEDDDAGDDDMAAFSEPKKPDVFSLLPPTTLVLDEWKRTYSNNRSEGYYPSMAWLWANLDKSGYSLWRADYKYNDENKVDWQTSNLIGGFLQRCDEVRKYTFGCMAVTGAAAPFKVSGVWLIRGHSIQPLIDSNPDAEYYEWKKLDSDDEAVRTMTGHYWCATETLDGAPIYDSKIHK